MVDLLGKRLGLEFHQHKYVFRAPPLFMLMHCRLTSSWLAHHPEEDLLLVQPDTFLVKDNKEALRRIILRWPYIDPFKSIFIYHETQLPIGEVRFTLGGRTDHNSALHELATDLKTSMLVTLLISH